METDAALLERLHATVDTSPEGEFRNNTLLRELCEDAEREARDLEWSS